MTITFFDQASHPVRLLSILTYTVLNPKDISTSGLASCAFARHYWRNLGWFLFLALLRCFSSGGSLHIPMYSAYDTYTWLYVGFPIRISTDHWSFASPRGFSQLITSFVGSQCQGILLVLFLAWTSSNNPLWFSMILHHFGSFLEFVFAWVSQIGLFVLSYIRSIVSVFTLVWKDLFYL